MNLTDKTHCLVTRNIGKFYITKIQANKVKEAITKDVKIITIDDSIIMVNDIVGIVTGEQIKDLEHKRMGEWKCKYNQWHQRGEQCGHDGKRW